MRKVTKRLLVAGFAALVMSACQDSVSIVQPAPPPPPPPPPGVDATVTIQGLRTIPGNMPINPTAVAGDINVVLNVEEGDNTVTALALLLDGTSIGCESISTNAAPGEGVSMSSGADTVECFFNTDDVVGACIGEQLDAAFANGSHTLGARITLSDGTTRTASNVQEITLVNSSFIMVGVVSEGATVIGSNGRLYHGGADLEFGACPVSYNGTVVGTVSLEAEDNGGGVGAACDQDQGGAAYGSCGDGDLGSGAGAPHADSSTPFVYTMSQSDNDAFDSGSGDSGTGVEDGGFGVGHTLFVSGSVFDADGLNVTSEFGGGSLSGIWIDLVPPRVNCSAGCAGFAASEITIDEPAAGSSTMLTWYSEGNFGLSNVVEMGSGWSFGSSASMDIGDCSDTDNSDAADATAFDPLFSGVQSMDDVNEEDWELGGDGFAGADSGDDCLLGELRTLGDEVGNAKGLADPSQIPAQIQTLTALGKDATGADISNDQPDATVLVLNDVSLMFDGLDPDLASGDPGSAVNEAGCGVSTGCTNVTAEIDADSNDANDGETIGVGNNATLTSADEDFIVDLTAGGTATFPLGDGDYTITVSVEDNATPPNESMHTWTFNLDTTAPIFGALNPAPVGSAGTDADAIVMTIGGTITDANVITTADLVFEYAGNAICNDGIGDTPLVVPTEIDRNDIDLTNGTSTIDFNETFTVNRVGSFTAFYCFTLTTEDEALDKTGADNPNMSSLTTLVTVVWN